MVQADQRNHALHAVQGDLQYHGVQKYLEVQRYQQSPVTKVHSSHLVSAQFKIVQVILFFGFQKDIKHSQEVHQHQGIPSLHQVLEIQQHQPHQGDQLGQSHHDLPFDHLFQRVRQVQVVQQLPKEV